MKEKNDKEKFKDEFQRRLYRFVIRMIKWLDTLPQDMVTKRMSDQLLRSETSVLANFVEGQSASSKKDFTNFFTHSLKSANASKVWFALLRDNGRAKRGDVAWFLSELEEIANIFASSILTLKNKK